jgi:alkylation response protein AidB-like acyl-CoA dehydrogenase
LEESQFRRFQEEAARVSGSLSFLQTQHQSAVSMIAKSDNDVLKSAYLPHMHNGDKLVGIGFSQLRRSGPAMMRAEQVEGGYRLNGKVPWITGWSFYPEFLVGATLPSGDCVFGVVPLVAQDGISFSPPMRLAAMESAQTVSGEFEDWLMPDDVVAFVKPVDWIRNNDMINVTLQGHFALGCARGGLDVLQGNASAKPLPFLASAYEALDRELEDCRAAISARSGAETSEDERLKLRAWAIDLAVRCAHAAVTSSSGAANSVQHPAQRIYREALVYTVSAQTTAIMEATLDRLTRRR